jgi:hypothetical protein
MVNYFVHCHACYINKTNNFTNPNIRVFFDTDINSESCSSELQIDFDKSNYGFSENYMSPKFDYILSFRDETYSSSKTSLKMFGIFDDNQNRIEIKNITNGSFNDILLSDLLQFLIPKNTPSKIYCGFCRNLCENSTPIPHVTQPLEYGTEDDDSLDTLYDIDLMDMNYGDMDGVDYKNDLLNGGKTRKKRNKYRKKQIKTITRRSKSNKRRTNKRRSSYKK